ncbi:MAG: hypothetical protein ACP5G4_00840 [bacterium]
MKLRVIILLSILAIPLFAQTASIETHAEPTTITIGDIIEYRVVITHSPNIEIAWPGAGAELGQFQITDYKLGDESDTEEGLKRREIIYYISTYDTGDWTIPPTAIAYTADDSVHFLRTEPIQITVKSLLSEEDWARIRSFTETDTQYAGMEKQIAAGKALQMAKEELLRDVTDIKRIPRDPKFWIGLGVVALILAGLIIGFLYWRKHRGKEGGIFSLSAPKIPPHEVALAEFAALLASQLIAKGDFKAFYSELSEILRDYIENRIGVQALELSTFETIQNLEESGFPLDDDQIKNVREILNRCDLVKFAKLIPPDDWHLETVEMARSFVEETKPEEPKIEEESSEETQDDNIQNNSETQQTEPQTDDEEHES